jgi:predicted protein tyrosine phosphatase
MFLVTCHCRAAVEAGEVSAQALISLTGTVDRPASIDPALFDGRVLRLTFDDIPWLTWRGGPFNEVFTGPTVDQVAEAMAFAGQISDSIAVHCLQGQSRSAGIALAIIADRIREPLEAVKMLLATAAAQPSAAWPGRLTATDVALAMIEKRPTPRPRPRIHPNPGIVRHAETLLNMPGELDAALIEHSEEYRWWRSQWVAEGWK